MPGQPGHCPAVMEVPRDEDPGYVQRAILAMEAIKKTVIDRVPGEKSSELGENSMAIAACVSTLPATTDREYSLLELGQKTITVKPGCVCSSLCGSMGDFHTDRLAQVVSLTKTYRDRKTFLKGAWGAGVIGKRAWYTTDKDVVCLEIRLIDEEAELVGHSTRGVLGQAADCMYSWVTMSEKTTVKTVLACIPRSLFDTIEDAVCRATQEKTGCESVAAVSAISFAKKHFQNLVKEGDVVLHGFMTLAGATSGVAAIAGFIATRQAKLIDLFEGIEDDADGSDAAQESDVDEAEDIVNECGMAISRRVPDTAPKELRESIKVRIFDDEQRADAAERANEVLPENKGVLRTTDRLIGPAIFTATASMDTSDPRTELSGVQRHLNKAKQLEYDPSVMEHFEKAADLVESILLAACDGDEVYEPKLPAGWSESATDESLAQIAEERPHLLKGFAKPLEVGLPIDKDARLVGTMGQADCAAMAMGVSLVEAMFKKKFPGAVTKGLNMKDLDAVMANRLRQFTGYSKAAKDKGMLSNDFSAMDSSWKPHEKVRVVTMVRNIAAKLSDNLYPDIQTFDPTVDADPIKGLVWVLRHMIVKLDVEDAILFSGERGTSLFNRILVLILRTAELARILGMEDAKALWVAMAKPTGGKHQDTGDGDDTAFNNPGYTSVEDCVASYRKYAKWIEPVMSDGHCMEVLSRYTTILDGKAYHLAKIARNTQRMVIGCFPSSDADAPFTAEMHAMTATTLLDRAIACKQTMVIRWYAMALCHYHISSAVAKGSKKTILDKDAKRLGDLLEANDAGGMDLWDRYNDVHDLLMDSRVSGYAMVEWTHWGNKLPKAADVKKLTKMWHDADEAMSSFEVNEGDFARPKDMVDRMNLPNALKTALSIAAKPLTFEVLLAGRLPPSSSEVDPGDLTQRAIRSRNDASRAACLAARSASSESTAGTTQGPAGDITQAANVKAGNVNELISLVVKAAVEGAMAAQPPRHSKGKGKGKEKGATDKSCPGKGKGAKDKSKQPAGSNGATNPGGAGIRRSSMATGI